MASIPNPNPIPNAAAVAYNYTIDPSVPNGGSGDNNSNTVLTTVNVADLGTNFQKSVTPSFADIGTTITYTITTNNSGNVTANVSSILDTIPNGTSFVSGSAVVNNTSDPTLTPSGGVLTANTGAVAPGGLITLTFNVVVTTIPNPNPIPDTGVTNYTYTKNPATPNDTNGTGLTNTVNTTVSNASFGNLTKATSQANAKIGDVLTYTITATNSGNTTANITSLIDTIPNGTTFVTGSAVVNNVANAALAPVNGLLTANTGVVAPGGLVTLTFKVTVTTLPNPNPIPNVGLLGYQYTVNPASPNGASGAILSNTVTTNVSSATFSGGSGVLKAADKTYVSLGDTVTYTITGKNTGNTSADNTSIIDTIPNNTVFVPNSVVINGSPSGISPVSGVLTGPVGTVAPGGLVTLTFQVVVTTIPNPNPIPNRGNINYQYTSDPAVPDGSSGSDYSNIVNVTVSQANFNSINGGIGKAGISYAKLGEVYTYTLTGTNTGNVTATNVSLVDTLPNGVVFVGGSAVINGTSSGISPVSGVLTAPMGSVAAGGLITLTFRVTVTTIPTPNPMPNQGSLSYNFTKDPATPNGASGANISNIVNTSVNQGGFAPDGSSNGSSGIIKSAIPFAKIGDIYTYTITATNNGNATVNSVVLIDTIPNGATFVSGSAVINGSPSGISPAGSVLSAPMGSVAPGGLMTLTFNVSVTTLPNPNPMPNSATATFTFTKDPALPNGATGSNISNIVNTTVSQGGFGPNGTSGSSGITKTTSKTYAQLGDVVTYTLTGKNTGNATITSVILNDTVPNFTTFVGGSAVINGSSSGISPVNGILSAPMGTVAPGGLITLTFNVTVVTIPTPAPSTIPNSGYATFNFTLDPAVPDGASGSNGSNIVNTTVSQGGFGPDGSSDGSSGITKSAIAYAKVGDIYTYTISATNNGNATVNSVVLKDTIPSGTSFVGGSAVINGSSSAISPVSGVLSAPMGNVAPGGLMTLTFNVTVTTIPNPNPIPNSATATYTFTKDPANPNGASGSNYSNITNTAVNQGGFGPGGTSGSSGITKTTSNTYAQLGDVITYTLTGTNNGNTTITNTVLNDTVPNYTTFVSNSVTINGTSNPLSPVNGVLNAPMGTVSPGGLITLTFQVTVVTIPTPSPSTIPNSGYATFNFTADPSVPNGASGANGSNIVNTTVSQGGFGPNGSSNGSSGITKVGVNYAKVNDIYTYTISATNTGNSTVNSVVLIDTIPNGTSFVAGSATINGAASGISPSNGVLNAPMGTVAPGGLMVLTFKVIVTTIPNPNPIPNSATATFTFTKDPANPNGASGSNISNIVNTTVSQGGFGPNGTSSSTGITKVSDKTAVQLGDLVTYTLTGTNTGNATITSVVLNDTVPNYTTFVSNSVIINGTSAPVSPTNGVINAPMGTVSPGGLITLTFQVTVVTVPKPNPIPNSGYSTYNYTVDPANPNGTSGINGSNIVNVTVSQGGFGPDGSSNGSSGITKVGLPFAKLSDIYTYTITATNTGNTTINSVSLIDTIPSATAFVAGSAVINGVSSGVSPVNGVLTAPMGSVGPGGLMTLTFQVTVITIPNPNPILNSAVATYTFTKDPANPNGASGSNYSNIYNTTVNQGGFAPDGSSNGSSGIVKSAIPFAKIYDVYTYTLTATNNGNTTVNSVVLKDTIPNGTAFVAGSATINGSPSAISPLSGVLNAPMGSVAPGGLMTLTFQVTVITLPNPNPIPNSAVATYTFTKDPAAPNGATGSNNSNITNTAVSQGGFGPNGTSGSSGITKTTSKTYAQLGDVITYTLTGTNKGNATITNTVLNDTVPNYTTFVDNSIVINGSPSPISPVNGIINTPMGTVSPGGLITLTFQVTVVTVPKPNPIPNSGYATFNFTTDPANPNGANGSNGSNIVNTTVSQGGFGPDGSSNGSGGITKVGVNYAKVNDVYTYTISATNNGNATINSVVLIDTIPSGTSFVAGSATINGTSSGISPSNGVLSAPMGSVAPGGLMVLTFKVTVTTIPNPNPIPNSTTATYTFTKDPASPNGANGSNISNIVNTTVSQGGFGPSGTSGATGITKVSDKTYAQLGDVVTYTLTGKNNGNTTITNTVLNDTVPNSTTFVPNSVIINGTSSPISPTNGVLSAPIGIVEPGGLITLTFQVTVVTIPTPAPSTIPNSGYSTYNYTVDPANPNGTSGANGSNIVNVTISQGGFGPGGSSNGSGGITKVGINYAKVNDVFTYTISATNNGNTTLNSIVLIDTIPSGTSFVAGSATINGAASGISPSNGVLNAPMGSVGPGGKITLAFKVTVTTIPNPNPIPNSTTATYIFTKDPANPNGSSGSNISNIVNTTVSQGGFGPSGTSGATGITKTESITYAQLGDVITYTLTGTNNGNATITNAVLNDTVPNYTTFVNNSVIINGIASSISPTNGVLNAPMGIVSPGGLITLTFKVTVVTIPTPAPSTIPNSGYSTYNYTVDPANPNGTSGANGSNIVNVTVSQGGFGPGGSSSGNGGITKVGAPYAKINDILTYTITATNNGNATINSVVFNDTIPTATTFVDNSVIINGVSNGVSPVNGVLSAPIGSVGPGALVTLTFKVTVTTLPNPNPISNSVNATYTFTKDPAVPNGASGSNNSNIYSTTINQGGFGPNGTSGATGITKIVNLDYAQVGEILTYTLTATNNGNTTVSNVLLIDTIPSGTSFITGSANVNGSASSISPANGVLSAPMGTVGPGGLITLSFRVTVTTIPTPNPIPNSAYSTYNYTVNPANPNGTSGTNGSNVANTTINQASFNGDPSNFTKVASSSPVKIGDIVTYVINGKNSGNATATNVVILDTIPSAFSFVSGSALINGVSSPSVAPVNNVLSVNMPNVGPLATTSLAFNVLVNSIPNPNPAVNIANISYNFTKDPAKPDGGGGSNNSNPSPVIVNTAIINAAKSANPIYADIGTTITYTITISNSGNVTATNIVFTDTVQSGSTFVPQSVSVNFIPNTTANPNTGIAINPIGPNASSVISFKVLVNSIPAGASLTNTALVNFTFNTGGGKPPTNQTSGSSTTTVPVNHAQIDTDKSIDHNPTAIGDTVTFTLISKNSGSVTANNVVVSDSLPNGLNFVTGSVTLNAVALPNANIVSGVNIGNVAPAQQAVISFKALVTTTNTISNVANANYNYLVDPTKPPTTVTVPSNTNTIVNNSPKVSVTKAASTTGAIVGDTIRYTITTKNIGKIDVLNVTVTDTLSSSLKYADTLTVNGIAQPQSDITQGVNVGNLVIGASAVVAFDAVVVSIPANGKVLNGAGANYGYQVVPGGPIIPGSTPANPNTVNGYNASVDISKISSRQLVILNQPFTYTIKVTNNGNITISNAILTDTLTAGMQLLRTTLNGTVVSGNITTGLPIGSLGIGQTDTVIIAVNPTTIPKPNPFVNTVVGNFEVKPDPNRAPSNFSASAVDTGGTGEGVLVENPELTIVKSSSVKTAAVGTTVTYTLNVKNTGDLTLNNIVIADALPAELDFVEGSIKVNNVSKPTQGISSGVDIGTLTVGSTAIVTFDAVVISKPSDGVISNIVAAEYDFKAGPQYPVQVGSNVSNQNDLTVVNANLSVIKTSDASLVSIGDTITYTVKLTNDGDIDLFNILFTDSLPSNVSLIDGTFTINGVAVYSVDLNKGVLIPSIKAGTTTILTYKVKVLSSTCSSKIVNSANASYLYLLPDGTSGNGQSKATSSSTNTINMTISNFKQLSVEEYLTVPCQKPDMESINEINGSVEIVKCHIIQTPTSKSNEGQIITGYKVIIHGLLNLTTEYTACEPQQGIHSAHYSIPFSSFVVLPTNYTPGNALDIEGIVEDVYFNDMDCRTFFTNTTLLLNIKLSSC